MKIEELIEKLEEIAQSQHRGDILVVARYDYLTVYVDQRVESIPVRGE